MPFTVFPLIHQMAEEEAKIQAPEEKEAGAEAPVEARVIYKPSEPYSQENLAAIRAFYKKRAKNPLDFTYDPDGNLETKEGAKTRKSKGAGEPAGTIILKSFVPLEPSERADIDDARMEALAQIDQEYEDEFVTLQTAWAEYTTKGAMHAVLSSNQRLTEIDARRNAIRSAVRNMVPIENPAVREIILSDRYEERKMYDKTDPFDKELVRLALYTFRPEIDQGKYVETQEDADAANAAAGEDASAEKASEMAYRQKLKDGRFARIFYDTDSEVNGFLSPMWVVDFSVNITGEVVRYSSPIQAYETERAKELGKAELAKSLLKTRSPRTVRLMTRQVQGHPKDAKGLWLKIYTAVYEEHPILKAKLLATASDALVYADTREGPSSIGLAEKDAGVLDPAKWKSENAVGYAQETVRSRMREGSNAERGAEGEPDAAAITEEQQAKAKVGAVINAVRGGWRRR